MADAFDQSISFDAELPETDDTLEQLNQKIQTLQQRISNPSSMSPDYLQEQTDKLEELTSLRDKITGAQQYQTPSPSPIPPPTPGAATTPDVTPKAPSPAPGTSLADKVNKVKEAKGQPEEETGASLYQKAQAARTAATEGFTGDVAEAKKARDEARSRADWGSLFEQLGKSVAQYGAARAGMKSGYDMSSGIKELAGVDWEARRKEIDQDYREDLSTAQEKMKQASEQAANLEKRGDYLNSEKWKQREYKLQQDKLDVTQKFMEDKLDLLRSATNSRMTQQEKREVERVTTEFEKKAPVKYALSFSNVGEQLAAKPLNQYTPADDKELLLLYAKLTTGPQRTPLSEFRTITDLGSLGQYGIGPEDIKEASTNPIKAADVLYQATKDKLTGSKSAAFRQEIFDNAKKNYGAVIKAAVNERNALYSKKQYTDDQKQSISAGLDQLIDSAKRNGLYDGPGGTSAVPQTKPATGQVTAPSSIISSAGTKTNLVGAKAADLP